MVEGGMAERDVIVAATATNAAILGIEQKVGTLETGKLADLIAVPGNPLKQISALRQVAGRTNRPPSHRRHLGGSPIEEHRMSIDLH
jgi:imidazolonepropionase-like amidohydrolase